MDVKRAFATFWTWYIEIPKSWKNKQIFQKKIFKNIIQTLSMPKNALDLPIFPSNPDL